MKVNARHLTVEDTRISVLGKPFANLPKVFPSLRERRKKKKQPPKTELTLKKPTNTQEGKFLPLMVSKETIYTQKSNHYVFLISKKP